MSEQQPPKAWATPEKKESLASIMSEQQMEKDAQGYSPATISDRTSRTVDTDASFLKPYLKPSDRILDVGCGPGTVTCGFSRLVDSTKGGHVIGIDSSKESIQRARELAQTEVPATIQLGNGNGHITSASFGNGATIQFMKEDNLDRLPFRRPREPAVRAPADGVAPHLGPPGMRRVLKPGGLLATRDVAELHFYPPRCEIDRVWAANMAKLLRQGQEGACLPGGHMPGLFRAAGFGTPWEGGGEGVGLDEIYGNGKGRAAAYTKISEDGGKMVVGAGTTVHAGREEVKRFAESVIGRLQPGDTFRESWRRAGITDQEVERTCKALEVWGNDEEAWYVALQVEMLAWK
ncbi:uncharacterized protein PG986_013747 [Apiospora aurea]|uniref:Methyltransferase domain-containing protein n=1 Tax=Apiospora aurea TaxID=335848 RepID=A0ABR1PXG7_9PEZI